MRSSILQSATRTHVFRTRRKWFHNPPIEEQRYRVYWFDDVSIVIKGFREQEQTEALE